ncbi:hypothetical protein PAUR_a3515 [Pseudoalteromonas aurantia 208]|uniref:Transposase n=1 Tax=Pseudoalteromonas aurantia 208 TaxID=1314867 RepID=A0ABR9E678_9GAMM|nr:hypothetical protein [Pseudoalteromonas aurantia 208]
MWCKERKVARVYRNADIALLTVIMRVYGSLRATHRRVSQK